MKKTATGIFFASFCGENAFFLLTMEKRCGIVTSVGFGRVPEWPKGTDCKSAAYRFGGSNPPSPTRKTDKFRLVGFSTKCAFRCVKFASQVKLSCGQ